MLTASSGARTPGLSMLRPGTTPYAPVDKPSGVGPTGYGAAPPTVKQLVPYTSAGSQARAGIGVGGATTTKTPPAAPSAAKPSTPTDNSGSIYNLDTDPIVQRIKALNTNNYAGAVANAQASAKQDLIGAGFNLADIIAAHPELGQGILGSVLADQATAEAAQQNPFSTAATLANTHNQNVHAIDQNDNAANLYYSSTRANQLGDEAHQYLGGVASAQSTVAQALAALLGGVTNEQQTENENLANAYDTARENAVTNSINSGEVLVGYDQNGNPIFTTQGSAGSSGATDGAPASSAGARARAGIGAGGATNTVNPATVATLAAALAPAAKAVRANRTGASTNRRQGVFAIH
jgi:hypothetical protein